jgi:hypothetical protein
MDWNKYNQAFQISMTKIEMIKEYLPFFIIWCIYIFIIAVLWIKSKIIADKIIGKSQLENINITLNYKSALSVGIILIGIYLIIDIIPMLFSYLSNIIISKSRFVDKDFLKQYTIKEVVEMIGIGAKIIVGLLIIKYNGNIINKIIEANKDKSNIA